MAYLEPRHASMIERFCIRKMAPPWIFDRVLNTPENLLLAASECQRKQKSETISRSLSVTYLVLKIRKITKTCNYRVKSLGKQL